MDFKTQLQALMQAHMTNGNADEIGKHMIAHGMMARKVAATVTDPYGPVTGNPYNVFPDENDPNYGNPFGGPSPDDGN